MCGKTVSKKIFVFYGLTKSVRKDWGGRKETSKQSQTIAEVYVFQTISITFLKTWIFSFQYRLGSLKLELKQPCENCPRYGMFSIVQKLHMLSLLNFSIFILDLLRSLFEKFGSPKQLLFWLYQHCQKEIVKQEVL